jgi:hypothetical protein
MSLVNQPIFRKGTLVIPISNKFTSSSSNFSTTVSMGNFPIQSQFCTYDATQINFTESSKYRISFSFYSKGLIFLQSISASSGGFRLETSSTSIGNLTIAYVGGVIENTFGPTSYYDFASDSLIASSVASNGLFTAYFNGSKEVTLQSGDFLRFVFGGNSVSSGSRVGYIGYIYIEQIS